MWFLWGWPTSLLSGKLTSVLFRATSHTRLKANDHCILILSLVEMAKAIQVHFTLEGEGLRIQTNCRGWKVYKGSYMRNYGRCFMVCRTTWSPFPGGRIDVNYSRPRQLNNCNSMATHVTPFGWESRAITITCVITPGSCVKWPSR